MNTAFEICRGGSAITSAFVFEDVAFIVGVDGNDGMDNGVDVITFGRMLFLRVFKMN
jgi:hypothetical protein